MTIRVTLRSVLKENENAVMEVLLWYKVFIML